MGNRSSYFPQDQTGKVAIVTGANTGIGFETAAELARLHAHVIVTCRSDEKGQETVRKIKERHPDSNVESMVLELSRLQSVRDFVQDFKAKGLPLHLLINNAGIMNTPYVKTEDGYEQQFAVNHLSHFLLTLSLLDVLKTSIPSKIINVSSSAHNMGNVDYSDLEAATDAEPKNYSGWKYYGRSKLANILFTYELARRLHGSGVTVNAVHPGLVQSDLQNNMRSKNSGDRTLFDSTASFIVRTLTDIGANKNTFDGATTTLAVACDPRSDNINGKYWVDRAVSTSNSMSRNVQYQRKLWNTSLHLTGIEHDPTEPSESPGKSDQIQEF